MVISDDGFMDATLEFIINYNDTRIKVFPQRSPSRLLGHEYATLNFENVLRNAKDDYIFLSDQDDVRTDNKVDVYMNDVTTYNYMVTGAYVMDANLNTVSETRFLKEGNSF